MKLQIDHIKDTPYLLHIDQPVEAFPILEELQSARVCRFTGPVSGEVSARKEYDSLRVTGDVSVPVSQDCSRCLASFDARLTSRFTVIYREEEAAVPADEDETELDEQDLVSSYYSGDEIDLSHEIGEQLAMEVPLKPLCSDDCRGICPECGADLNSTGCDCASRSINFKFSALKDFKVQQK